MAVSLGNRVSLFQSLFVGQRDVYGTYNPQTQQSWQVKASVDSIVYHKHLKGEQPLALYPILAENLVRFAAIDFDEPDGNLPIEARACAKHHGFQAYTEASRSKGFHCWFFFRQPVPAWKVRALLSTITSEIGYPKAEIFPKQSQISKGGFGNCINLPLFGASVRKQRTVFLDDQLNPVTNQWEFLASIKRHSLKELNTWIELNEIEDHVPLVSDHKTLSRTFGLMPCASRMLNEGVTFNQRVACFRLAVQLRKTGLSADLAYAVLRTWSLKNRPSEGKAILSTEEVREQTLAAYKDTAYLGCGCEEEPVRSFCDTTCPLYAKKALK